LKSRRVGGTETLILREAVSGSVAVRREWTDWDTTTACEASQPAQRLAFEALLELAKLIEQLVQPARSELDR
jgi:hypothetical protein